MLASRELPDLDPDVPVPPPGEDELPYDFGPPMDSNHHRDNMNLLVDSLRLHWADRERGAVEGNMAFYFKEQQVHQNDFLGPDVFVVSDGVKRNRKSWVMWQESLPPDVVIELLSARTEKRDRGEKKEIYARMLRVTDYFLFDPTDGRFEGFRLDGGQYHPLELGEDGLMPVSSIGMKLGLRWSVDHGERLPWLRWFTDEGELVLTMRAKLIALGLDRDA